MDVFESAGKNSGWLKFFGIINIIIGTLQAITIIGIIFAWIPIWIGIVALQAGSLAEKAKVEKKEENIVLFHNKIGFLFKLIGIFIIVGIVIGIIATIAALAMTAFLTTFLSEYFYY